MTTEANGVVEPIHEKAMPVMLMTPDDVEQWLRGSHGRGRTENAEARAGRCDCDPASGKEGGLAQRTKGLALLASGSSPQ